MGLLDRLFKDFGDRVIEAVESQDQDAVKQILSEKFDPARHQHSLSEALLRAIHHRHSESAKALIESGADIECGASNDLCNLIDGATT